MGMKMKRLIKKEIGYERKFTPRIPEDIVKMTSRVRRVGN